MSSLEAQIIKLSDKYVHTFIKYIIENKTNINEDDLLTAWKTVSGSGSKKTKTGKKRRTGYTTYLMEKRPIVAKANPNMKTTEIVSKIAAEWKSLEQSEQEVYNKKARDFMDGVVEEKQNDTSQSPIPPPTPIKINSLHPIMNEEPFENLNIKQLKSMCEKYELFTVGKKKELIERLNGFKKEQENFSAETDEDEN